MKIKDAVEQFKRNVEQDILASMLRSPKIVGTAEGRKLMGEIVHRRFQEAVLCGQFHPDTTYEIKDILVDGESIMNAKDINTIDFKTAADLVAAPEPTNTTYYPDDLITRFGYKDGFARSVVQDLGDEVTYVHELDVGKRFDGDDLVTRCLKSEVSLVCRGPKAPKDAPEPIKVGDEVEHLICQNVGVRRVVTKIQGDLIYYDHTSYGFTLCDLAHKLRVVKRAAKPTPTPKILPAASYGFYTNEPDIDRIFRENPGCNVIEVNDQVWVRNNVFNFVRDHFNLVKDGIDGTTPDGHEQIHFLAVESIVLALRNRKHFTVKAYR